MFYLPETAEYYTPLFFNSDYDEDDTGSVERLSDSVVYQKGKIIRKRIPVRAAQTIFMMDDLDALHILDPRNGEIFTGSFLRVEYLDNVLEDKFIAVYAAKIQESDPAERYYCTSEPLTDRYINDFSYRILNDNSLNQYIVHRLNRNQKVNWSITNIEVLPSRATYSIVNSSSESFVTELYNDHFNVVITMNQGHRIENIVPLPFEFNEHPLMFITTSRRGQTSLKTSLAIFADYLEYKFVNGNRLRIK